MAAAEARAAWQRTANRCFVQEDAKRAPKLACCPSSSSKLQPDEAQADVGNGVDQSGAHLLPHNWNLSNYNLSPDTKWWLQLQPNYGNHRELVFEQLKAMESEFDGKPPANLSPPSAFSEETTQLSEDFACPDNMNNPASESTFRVSTTNLKHEIERRAQELKTANACQPLNGEVVFYDNLKSEINSKVATDSKQFDDFDHLKLGQAENGSFDISMPWVTDKDGPWWRVTDKDELASLVAQSAVRHIENCDLPQPRCANSRTSSIGIYEGFDRKKLSPSPFDHKPCTACSCSHIEGPQQHLSGGTNRVQNQSALLLPPAHVMVKNSSNSCEGTKESSGTFHSLDVHASKVQLLEALCHSQTRAREAETAAQRAHSEKEHIIKLFLKQATHLFAYKQWFRLLQLETIYLQLKCKDSALVPWDQLSALFPLLSARGEQHGDGRNKKRKREDEHNYDVGKFALAVAVGVSLAGAGLFLGWSLGWLLPTF